MKLSAIIKIIDLLSFITLTFMVSTGILVKFTLPPKSGQDHVWGLTRHEWGDVHFYFSIAFLIFITSHLLTHFKYIKAVVSGKGSTESNYRIAFGLLGVIALVLLAFAPVTGDVTEVEKTPQYKYRNR